MIIIGGIYGGIFTPTEAAAVAVVYGIFVGLFIYRELKFRDFPQIIFQAVIGTTMIMLLVGAANVFGWMLTNLQIPHRLGEAVVSVTSSPLMFLVALNILLLIAGMFLNAVSAIALFTPILLPIMTSVGVNPYLMGIVMIVNLGIGMITPPVGNCLYVACGMSKRLSFEQISKACIPYIVMLMIALLLITYVEPISMGLIWLTSASAI